MSENSVNKPTPIVKSSKRRFDVAKIIALPVWVFVSFVLANIIIAIGLILLKQANIYTPDASDAMFNTIVATLVYVLTLSITMGVPWLIRRRITSKTDLGLTRLPTWMDILLAPAGAVVYLILSGILVTLFSASFPQVDLQQAQDVGFENLVGRSQYLLAFITLVILAPLAEETLFRVYLYGKLRKSAPVWLAILTTSALFGLAHGQWNVGLDTFALSFILCSLREVTGSIWAGVLLHMMKNGLAFYLLFVNPSLLSTLGG